MITSLFRLSRLKIKMSSTKMSQDAKKEEFKKYLEKAGVLELLTKSLVSLYEEPEKPGDAVNYLKKTVGGTDNDKQEIEKLQTENTELKAKVCFVVKQRTDRSLIVAWHKCLARESNSRHLSFYIF